MRGDQLALPLRRQQILPRLRRLGGGHGLGVVGDHVHGGAEPVVVAVLVLEARRKAVGAGRRVLQQELLVLQEDIVTGVGRVDHVHVLDVRLQLLHDALQDPLRPGPVHLGLDAGILGLEELGDLLGSRQRQRRVPDDLAFLPRGIHPRVLRRRGHCRGQAREEDDRRQSLHHRLLHGTRHRASSVTLGSSRSRPTRRASSSTRRASSTTPALPQNFASASCGVTGCSGPPRECS